MLSSMASQTHVAPHADSVGREAKSEVTRIEEELEGKRFEAIRPKMLEVDEVLAAPALEYFIPARPVYGTKSGIAKAVAGRSKVEGNRPDAARYHFGVPLGRTKRIRSKWLDDCTVGGAEVKSRLVATKVAYRTRDDCFLSTRPLKAALCGQLLRHREDRDSRSSTSWRLLGMP